MTFAAEWNVSYDSICAGRCPGRDKTDFTFPLLAVTFHHPSVAGVATMRPSLNHMGIFVQDPPLMEQFYVAVFDLVVTDRGQGHLIKHDLIFLSSDPNKHHQLVLASGRPKEATFSTVMQLSFKVEALDDLRRIWAVAESHGASAMRSMDHGNSWSIYFLDPEGNTVEVYLDTPFHVPQPYAHVLDLRRDDASILAETERLARRDPGFAPRADFQRSMATLLNSDA